MTFNSTINISYYIVRSAKSNFNIEFVYEDRRIWTESFKWAAQIEYLPEVS